MKNNIARYVSSVDRLLTLKLWFIQLENTSEHSRITLKYEM